MVFFEFEKFLESFYEQFEKIKQVGKEGGFDVFEMMCELENKIKNKCKEIYSNFIGWQKV